MRPSCPIRIVSALALALCAAAPSEAQQEGLTLESLYELARSRSPGLQAMAASARAATLRAPAAGALPDPSLQVGYMNFAVPELTASMAMSMAPSVQLTQMLPFPGKLGLRGAVADREAEAATAAVEETWWVLRRGVAEAFFDLYELDGRIEVERATLSVLENLRSVAMALYASGTGRQSDVLRAGVEVARLEGELLGLQASRAASAARLNALLDRPADTPLPRPVVPALPGAVPDLDTLRAWAEASRPLLGMARARLSGAEAEARLADREIWPDLMVGLGYGQRDLGGGVERMGSAMLGVTIPIHAGRRQRPLRDASQARASGAEAELENLRADLDARLVAWRAGLERDRTLLDIYRGEILPQARTTVESALSSYRVGDVDFPTVLDAQLAVLRYERDVFRLVHDYGSAVAGLEAEIGRPLPVDLPLLEEAR